MKIKSVKYRIQGISDSLLENLSDEATIQLLTSWFHYKNSIFITFVVEDILDDIFSNFDKLVKKDTFGVSHNDSTYSGKICYREYELKSKDVIIDFRNLVNLKDIHENPGSMIMKLKSDDYFERTVAQMIFNLIDYL